MQNLTQYFLERYRCLEKTFYLKCSNNKRHLSHLVCTSIIDTYLLNIADEWKIMSTTNILALQISSNRNFPVSPSWHTDSLEFTYSKERCWFCGKVLLQPEDQAGYLCLLATSLVLLELRTLYIFQYLEVPLLTLTSSGSLYIRLDPFVLNVLITVNVTNVTCRGCYRFRWSETSLSTLWIIRMVARQGTPE